MENQTSQVSSKPCFIKLLPSEKWHDAAQKAISINPANAPAVHQLLQAAPDANISAEYLSILTQKYWGADGAHFTVGFLDNPSEDLKAKILENMNAWSNYANVSFVEGSENPQIRISRTVGGGYWSYLGTDISSVDSSEPTMNLDDFSMDLSDAEFHRVVRHETGHTLGFPHEHMREEIVDNIDRQKAITYFGYTQGWSEQQVINQVLTPLDNSKIQATAHADEESIMCYALPWQIMKDGKPVTGGIDIDDQDASFAALMYPKTLLNPPPSTLVKTAIDKPEAANQLSK
jgi:Astacin (Peptidase family M12A)